MGVASGFDDLSAFAPAAEEIFHVADDDHSNNPSAHDITNSELYLLAEGSDTRRFNKWALVRTHSNGSLSCYQGELNDLNTIPPLLENFNQDLYLQWNESEAVKLVLTSAPFKRVLELSDALALMVEMTKLNLVQKT